ncbi:MULTISPECIES: hypothetical protein [unclassified Microcoleus]|uniref:hypothetical protein n=1 Tax=unclassified Microcoleus TaxID=2642155 RepID=UPI0025DCA584|nr:MULTISPECIES: hypothetical protein [unclassified Microcoleus]
MYQPSEIPIKWDVSTMLASFRPKSTPRHRLSRFVTKEAIARLLKIAVEQIYRFECWAHILYVHAQGMSRFVSYADFPPVVGVESPSGLDFGYWKRRMASLKERYAPDFWVDFYAERFREAVSVAELLEWGELVGVVKLMLGAIGLESLRKVYAQEKSLLEHF